jgi:hypothetical protein
MKSGRKTTFGIATDATMSGNPNDAMAHGLPTLV